MEADSKSSDADVWVISKAVAKSVSGRMIRPAAGDRFVSKNRSGEMQVAWMPDCFNLVKMPSESPIFSVIIKTVRSGGMGNRLPDV